MNLRFLDTAIILAECKSFRLTAERLHTTQAAISSRIAVLEEEFGQRLFERTTKNVSLTPAGTLFVEGARDVLLSFAALQRKMTKVSELEGVVRIGAVSSMVHFLLPELIARIRARYPAIDLDVVTDDTGQSFLEQLKAGSIDLCLTAVPEHTSADIETRELCVIDMAWVSAPRLIADIKTPLSPADLANYPIITYAHGSINGQRIKAYLQGATASRQRFLTSTSLSASIRMAMEGLGLAVIPEFVAAREIDEGKLLKLRLEKEYPATLYCTMYSKGRAKPGIASLAELCSDVSVALCSGTSEDVVKGVHHPDFYRS